MAPELPVLDLMSPAYQRDPAEATRALRAEHRLARSAFGIEVLRHADCVELFRDERIGHNFELQMPMLGLSSGKAYDHMTRQLGNQEGAAHRRLRRLIMPAFSATAMERLRGAARSIFAELLDARLAAGGVVDLARDVAAPYPSVVFCRFLGVPDGEAPTLARMNRSIFKMFWRDPANRDEIESAFGELTEYVEALIERRRREPGDDFVSRLIKAEEEGSRLTTDEMVDMVKVSLWAAVDNIAHTLSTSVALFAEHPAQWDVLRERRALVGNAVEECMRVRPRFHRIPCYVRQDVELAGRPIAAGSWVTALVASASRDAGVFSDPDRFDITREPVPPNMNFGASRHQCAGIHLARVQLQETLAVLVERYRRIDLAGDAVHHHSLQTSGIDRLPVRLIAA